MKPAPRKFRTMNLQTFNKALKSRDSRRIWVDPAMSWHGRPSSKRRCSEKISSQLFLKKACGRGDTIRTCGLYVPNVALYRAELHPDDGRCKNSSGRAECKSAFTLLSIAAGWGGALCQWLRSTANVHSCSRFCLYGVSGKSAIALAARSAAMTAARRV
jgi:hypothetical protein